MKPIIKSARIEKSAVSEKDVAEINEKYALKSLSAEDIFTFKLAVCDNQIDREFEKFSDNALSELAKLYVGRTILCDHEHLAKNQCARIYDAGVEDNGGVKRLVTKCYTVRTEATKDFIEMLSAGIMKEVSVACRLKSAVCSVCGTDNAKSQCNHIHGRTYGDKQCYFTLDDPVDAFEVSFVAVPAQKEAGVIKSYGGEKAEVTEANGGNDGEEADENEETEKALEIGLGLAEAFIMLNENEEDNNHD